MLSLLPRALIKISGVDAVSFLQGITTNDFSRSQKSNSEIKYTAFLDYRGRVLYDSMVYCFPTHFLLECIKPYEFANFLKKYSLRRSIKIEREHSFNVIWSQNYVEGAFSDPRTDAIGFRILSEKRNECNNKYQYRLYELGIAEGSDIEQGAALPFHYNLDLLNCLSFSKGCYIGQEHVLRMHNEGVVRRRILPLRGIKNKLQCGSDIFVKHTKEKAGVIINHLDNVGIGLLKLQGSDIYASTLVTSDGQELTTFKPTWWPRS